MGARKPRDLRLAVWISPLDESEAALDKQEENLRVSAPPRDSPNIIAAVHPAGERSYSALGDASYLSVPISVHPWLNLLRKLG